MKKCLAIVLLVVFVLSNTSCATTAVYIEEDADILGEIVYMTHVSEQHRISVQIPRFESDAINGRIQSYIAEHLRSNYDFKETLSLSSADIETDIQGDYSDCFADIDCEIACKTEERISVLFKGVFNRKTAAHPTRCFFTLNLDPATGERVMFKEVYAVNDELYDCFASYARKALAENADEQWWSDVEFSELCPKDRFLKGLETEEEYTACFTQAGVIFCYPVAHAIGDYQTVEIPYQELHEFLL